MSGYVLEYFVISPPSVLSNENIICKLSPLAYFKAFFLLTDFHHAGKVTRMGTKCQRNGTIGGKSRTRHSHILRNAFSLTIFFWKII